MPTYAMFTHTLVVPSCSSSVDGSCSTSGTLVRPHFYGLGFISRLFEGWWMAMAGGASSVASVDVQCAVALGTIHYNYNCIAVRC